MTQALGGRGASAGRAPLSRYVATVLALSGAIGLAGCGGGAPSDGELAEQEPEQALAEMAGVAAVEREFDVSEDDFYVNEVTVDAEGDVTAGELAAILDVMSFYDRGEEPVGGTIYLDAGTTDFSSSDGPERSTLYHEPGSEGEQLARAETFLTAIGELDGADVVVEGDELRVAPLGFGDDSIAPSDPADALAVLDAARVIRGGELAEVPEIGVDSADFSLRLDPEIGERNLAAWERLVEAARASPDVELARLRIASLLETPQSASIEACLRTSRSDSPAAIELTPERYGESFEPILGELLLTSRGLGADARLEAQSYVEQPGRYVVCEPFLTTVAGEAERDPFRRGWEAEAERLLKP